MNESSYIQQCVVSRISMSYFTYMNVSCHVYNESCYQEVGGDVRGWGHPDLDSAKLVDGQDCFSCSARCDQDARCNSYECHSVSTMTQAVIPAGQKRSHVHAIST